MFMFMSWLFLCCRENSLLRAQKDEADSVQSLAKSGHVTQSSQPITTHDMFVALQVNTRRHVSLCCDKIWDLDLYNEYESSAED